MTDSCCAPISTGLTASDAEDLASTLKILADPARLRIVSILAVAGQGEACVCDLTDPLDLSQPTVSHHLKVLREAGVVTTERRGTYIYYDLAPDFAQRWAALGASLAGLVPVA